jgi:transcriptional regulator with XRE-family HTH domain
MSRNANSTDRYVGKRVRMRRLMIKMSQEKLADRLGLTFQQVQKYEKGVNRISASRLREMANALQVPIQFFFEGLPEAGSSAARDRHETSHKFVHDFLATSDGLALAAAFTRIDNSKVRRRIVQLVKEFAGEAGGKKK